MSLPQCNHSSPQMTSTSRKRKVVFSKKQSPRVKYLKLFILILKISASYSYYILQLITRKTHFLKLIFQLPKENCLLNGWLQSQSIFDVLPQLVMCGCLVSILKFCVFFTHLSYVLQSKLSIISF